MTTSIRRTDLDGIVTVTFTRDEKLNAITDPMLDELGEIVADVRDSEDLRVLVITAEGRYFTAGLDFQRFAGDQPSSGITIRRRYREVHLLFDEMEALEKPIIHAAQGPCFGAGVEIAVSCDFRLAAERATYALPEIANLAVIPGSGGISRLTRLVGPHWARWMAMAGEQVDAQHAVTMGLVHQVYPDDQFPKAVQDFAQKLLGFSREALALAKLGIDAAASTDRKTARDVDRIANTLLFKSDEFRDKVTAFEERRRNRS
jgi:enoyl-CoA hydratase/carnithine racemase